MTVRLLLTLWLFLTLAAEANAGPIGGLIAGAVSFITSLGPIGQLIVGVALRVGASLIQRATRKDTQRAVSGVKGSLRGGDQPLSFIVGTYATAGSLEYVGTWGTSGNTPNAYLTQVISLSDLPCSAMSNIVWINGEQCTIDWGADETAQGYPVTQYRRGGKDYLWIRFHDGSQTSADAFLTDKFSAGDRPWQPDMVGYGIAYAIVTSRFNREVFTGGPSCKFVLQGLPLYDPRKDSTVGGSGTQRWNNPSTWAFSDNPKVIQYNIIRGISYDGRWFYGGQNMLPFQLPVSNWMAAMNECDRLVAKSGGGTEKQFRAGAEIECGDEPLSVIKELDKACSGRTAELGGIYKTMCGAPGLPVYSFTDDDMVITEPQEFDQFPGLESTFNGVNSVYPEPQEGWVDKEAPPLLRPAYETADGGNRLPINVQYPYVFVKTQVQRLNRAMVEEARRFRRHNAVLPPETWKIEPLDTVSWTSRRNGYEAKRFLMGAMDDLPNVNQAVALQEIDPGDYDWSSDYELPDSVGPTGPIRPPSQVVDGWEVYPETIRDSDGNERRAAILVLAPDGLDDVRSVRVRVRQAETGDIVFDSDAHPYEDPWQWILNGNFLPAEDYEVRCQLVPYSGRPTTPSEWLPVTTPNVKLGGRDVFSEVDLSGVKEALGWLQLTSRNALEAALELSGSVQEIAALGLLDKQALRRELTARAGALEASYLEVVEVAVTQIEALAGKVETLTSAMGGNTAQVNVRWATYAGPSGYAARYGIVAAANDGDYRSASLLLDVPANPASPTRIILQASQIVMTDGTNLRRPFVYSAGVLYLDDVRVNNLAALSANLGTVTAGVLQSANGKMTINLNAGTIVISS